MAGRGHGSKAVGDRTLKCNVVVALVALLAVGLVSIGEISAQQCAGDCNGDMVVEVDELVLGVSIGLGDNGVEACPEFDSNSDQRVTVDELLQAILAALDGCPAGITPTPTPNPCIMANVPAVNPLAAQTDD